MNVYLVWSTDFYTELIYVMPTMESAKAACEANSNGACIDVWKMGSTGPFETWNYRQEGRDNGWQKYVEELPIIHEPPKCEICGERPVSLYRAMKKSGEMESEGRRWAWSVPNDPQWLCQKHIDESLRSEQVTHG